MNILFLTLIDFYSINQEGIYTDLLREFVKNNHSVYVVSPFEGKKLEYTHIIDEERVKLLKLKTGPLQKTNLIKKGINIITLESKITSAIKSYFKGVKFDLVIYSTPPITLKSVVRYIKKRDNARTYLLLKDIFPQNAVDLEMINSNGLFSFIYNYFRSMEKGLYEISDYIGCMSQANVDYVLSHNPSISPNKIEVCPNSISPNSIVFEYKDRALIRSKYNIPINKTVYIYGGNLGKPQGVDFIIDFLKEQKIDDYSHFVIVGSGTEYGKLERFLKNEKPNNVTLLSQLAKHDYDMLVNTSDVGLIFLDYRFTIPNFPSRLLSYMQASLPIIAATDVNTDIGKIIEEGGFGYCCESNNTKEFSRTLQKTESIQHRIELGKRARKFLEENYLAEHSYKIIMKHFE